MSSFLFSPKISIQKEEVNAVNAPSALGKSAEINPIIKIIEMAAGIIAFKATVGKRSSPWHYYIIGFAIEIKHSTQ